MANEIALNSEMLTQVVNMTVYDIALPQICAATGLSEADVLTMKESAEFKQQLAAVSVKDFEQNKTLNEAWDMAEAQALGIINDTLEWSKDPDFALRAAMMANKARRRGNANDHQIPAQAGVRAVINLTANFVEKMQQMNITPRGVRDVSKKQNDFLDPKQIEQMLDLDTKEERSAEGVLMAAGVNFCLAGE